MRKQKTRKREKAMTVKIESRNKSSKDKEKKKPEEPPRYPGLILQTKWSNDYKKLCVRFVRKRCRRKRQHEECYEAENVEVSSCASEMLSAPQPDDENEEEKNDIAEDQNSLKYIDEMEHETDDEEDPKEYEEMEDSSAENNEEGNDESKNDEDKWDKSVKEQPEMKDLEAESNVNMNTHEK